MLLYTMLYIVLAYLMLFAALTNSVCLNNASFFFLFKYFLCQGYELSGEIALKNNHYYYYYYITLAGDFILPDVDWSKKFVSNQCRYSTLSNQLINTTLDYNLHQVVTSPTRENNILDLVFTNVPFLVQNASILPGLSDHDMVSVKILISPVRIKQPRKKISFKKREI